MKRGWLFWGAIAGATLFGCCVLTLIAAGLAASGTTPASPTGAASAADTSTATATATDTATGDDVEHVGANGLTYVAPLTVVAPQVLSGAQLISAWKDSKHNFGLQLGSDGSYRITFSSAGGGSSVVSDEQGRWALEQGQLTLTPTTLKTNAISMPTMHPTQDEKPGGPARHNQLNGVVLEYARDGVKKRVDGLQLSGEAPDWFSFTKRMDLTLYRARSL